MKTTRPIGRRQFLAAGLSTAGIAAGTLLPSDVLGYAAQKKQQAPGFFRFQLGFKLVNIFYRPTNHS